MKKIAILALQGAFAEHEQRFRELGAETFLVRQASDWLKEKDALVLPGGESTAQARLLHDLDLFQPIRRDILSGLPVMATCAGLILLSPMHLATMHIRVRRNAYGRQLGSFRTVQAVEGVGTDVPMTFIRAPYIEATEPPCRPLATVDGHIVAAQEGRQLALAFHPELDTDLRLHRYFLGLKE